MFEDWVTFLGSMHSQNLKKLNMTWQRWKWVGRDEWQKSVSSVWHVPVQRPALSEKNWKPGRKLKRDFCIFRSTPHQTQHKADDCCLLYCTETAQFQGIGNLRVCVIVKFESHSHWTESWPFGPKTGHHPACDLLYHISLAHVSRYVQKRTFPCMSKINYCGLTLQTNLKSWCRGTQMDESLTLMSDVTANLCYHWLRPGNNRLKLTINKYKYVACRLNHVRLCCLIKSICLQKFKHSQSH